MQVNKHTCQPSILLQHSVCTKCWECKVLIKCCFKCKGLVCGAMHTLLSIWAPPFERSTLGTFAYSGGVSVGLDLFTCASELMVLLSGALAFYWHDTLLKESLALGQASLFFCFFSFFFLYISLFEKRNLCHYCHKLQIHLPGQIEWGQKACTSSLVHKILHEHLISNSQTCTMTKEI